MTPIDWKLGLSGHLIADAAGHHSLVTAIDWKLPGRHGYLRGDNLLARNREKHRNYQWQFDCNECMLEEEILRARQLVGGKTAVFREFLFP